jgi:hypothetical protein
MSRRPGQPPDHVEALPPIVGGGSDTAAETAGLSAALRPGNQVVVILESSAPNWGEISRSTTDLPTNTHLGWLSELFFKQLGGLTMLAAGIGSLLVAYGGIMLMTVALPFVASYLLDCIVQVLRNNGLKLFLAALAMTVVVAGGGYLLWQYGVSNPPVTPETLASMGMVAQMLATYSTALALFAFVIRTGSLLWKTRRRAA